LIFGTGIDIIEVERIKQSLSGTPAMKKKLYSTDEQEYCEQRRTGIYQCFAARFAAKEAFFKALGTGYRYGMAFHEIEVVNDELGKPFIKPHGKVQEFLKKNGITGVHLSISHVKNTAVAMVILEKNNS
jgi:holo-[acyl-carrier protein] synthase